MVNLLDPISLALIFVGVLVGVFVSGFFLQVAAGMAEVPADRARYLKCTGLSAITGFTYAVLTAAATAIVFAISARTGFPSRDTYPYFAQVFVLPLSILVCSLWCWLFFRGHYGKSFLTQLIHTVALILLTLSVGTLFLYGRYWLVLLGQLLFGRPS